MKKINLLAVAAMLLLTACGNDGWADLFNGKDFTGFKQLGGDAPYIVEDGCMVGISKDGVKLNSFMTTEQLYGDFILEFEVWAHPDLNSGVQFRSEARPDGSVFGYQCEIESSSRAWAGGLYDEGRRGWLVTNEDKPEAKAAFKVDDWNSYRIEAIGNNIRIWLNGVNTTNLYDSETATGFIGFQVHSIYTPENDKKQIKWRNIRIKTTDLENSRMQGELTTAINRVPNTLLDEEVAAGWKLLFDGETATGWRGAHKEAFPESGWTIKDGQLIVHKMDGGESTNGGDIVTEEMFGAFELLVEFKFTEGANSGIKYFVTEQEKGKGSSYGLEYQVLDDGRHPDAAQYTSFPGSRTLASLYDLIPAVENKRANGPGQWNLARVVVCPNNHVEHWLNGFKTLEYERGSDAFRELVKGSKYAAKEYNEHGRFGEAPAGRVLLQDHGDEVAFRSVKIRTIK